MAIVLNDGYLLEGDAGTASKIDYTVSGLNGTALITLASGQLADAKATLYTASGVDTISSITLFNTHSSAMAVNLYVNDGTSRQIVGIDSLGIGYHATFNGTTLNVYDNSGSPLARVQNTAHAATHKDGAADEILLNEFGEPTSAVKFNGQQAEDLVLHTVADDAARNALVGVKGKICYKTDDNSMYMCTDVD